MSTKTQSECETKVCNYTATRTRFYNGMLLTDEHLRAEQNYFRDALRRLTRSLFGWGVVCGLEVPPVPKGLCIKVNPGVAIDCCGNLIEVCKCITLDFSKLCQELYGTDCIPQTTQAPIQKYLVLRYVEKETDPMPVLTPPDDCSSSGDKPNCQASKIQEGYCLELWDRCPCEDPEAEPEKSLAETILELSEPDRQQAQQAAGQPQWQPGLAPGRKTIFELLKCAPCSCCENAVGLAYLKIDCENKTVTVDAKKCRRQIMSSRLLDAVWGRAQNEATRQLADLTPQLANPATAHFVANALEFERSGKELERLDEELARIRKDLARVERLAKKQPPPAAPK